MKRILWAIDPYEPSNESAAPAARALKALSAAGPLEIEPVYVLNRGNPALALQLDERATAKALSSVLKPFRVPGLKPPRILRQDDGTTAGAIRALLAYAKTSRPDLIACGTHGRKGVARLLLGSFAESLLLRASTPVLVAGPGARLGASRELLFPTDFSTASYTAFRKAVHFASDLGWGVRLLHVTPHPVEPLVQEGVYLLGGGWVTAPDPDGETAPERTAKRWLAYAKKRGVSASLVVDAGRSGVKDAILERGADVGMIAMAAQSGAVGAALIGSVSREVAREASCPVWIVRA